VGEGVEDSGGRERIGRWRTEKTGCGGGRRMRGGGGGGARQRRRGRAR
jgi:hypothetical protein